MEFARNDAVKARRIRRIRKPTTMLGEALPDQKKRSSPATMVRVRFPVDVRDLFTLSIRSRATSPHSTPFTLSRWEGQGPATSEELQQDSPKPGQCHNIVTGYRDIDPGDRNERCMIQFALVKVRHHFTRMADELSPNTDANSCYNEQYGVLQRHMAMIWRLQGSDQAPVTLRNDGQWSRDFPREYLSTKIVSPPICTTLPWWVDLIPCLPAARPQVPMATDLRNDVCPDSRLVAEDVACQY